MPVEITLSLMNRHPRLIEILKPLISQFEAQTHTRVKIVVLEWEEARTVLNQDVLYHRTPDVTEIGTTWIADLVGMNALRPFPRLELTQMGWSDKFLPSTRRNCQLMGDEKVWAIPWLAETFVIHYRRDLLEKAGLDEATAFESFKAIDETVAALRQSGMDVPLGLPLKHDQFENFHCLAPWVWGRGADYISADGKTVLFDQPSFIEAVRDYYGLMRHVSPEGLRLCREVDSRTLFLEGRSALVFASQALRRPETPWASGVGENWGIASFPGGSFVGGSNLVVWNQTLHERQSAELVRFLTGRVFLTQVPARLAVIPPRVDVLNGPPYTEDPILDALAQAVSSGRTYTALPLWGVVEERLMASLLEIWDSYQADPAVDLESVIRKTLSPITRRLNLTLAQYKA